MHLLVALRIRKGMSERNLGAPLMYRRVDQYWESLNVCLLIHRGSLPEWVITYNKLVGARSPTTFRWSMLQVRQVEGQPWQRWLDSLGMKSWPRSEPLSQANETLFSTLWYDMSGYLSQTTWHFLDGYGSIPNNPKIGLLLTFQSGPSVSFLGCEGLHEGSDPSDVGVWQWLCVVIARWQCSKYVVALGTCKIHQDPPFHNFTWPSPRGDDSRWLHDPQPDHAAAFLALHWPQKSFPLDCNMAKSGKETKDHQI